MSKFKFLSYIVYFIIAEFLISNFNSKIKKEKGFESYSEKKFKGIFEFWTTEKQKSEENKRIK
jgi:hypothetical protein